MLLAPDGVCGLAAPPRRPELEPQKLPPARVESRGLRSESTDAEIIDFVGLGGPGGRETFQSLAGIFKTGFPCVVS